MKTTKIGNEVMKFAFSKISVDHEGNKYPEGCHEPNNDNVVYCGKPATRLIFTTIGDKKGDSAQWCAAFVYYVYSESCKKLGIKNLVPFTASVLTMLSQAKAKGLKVDNIPSAGAIAIRRTGETTKKKLKDGGTVSHAFIVYAVTSDLKQLIGLEGNSGNAVKMNYYPRAESPYGIEDHLFIHAELMPGGESEVFHPFEFKAITTGTYKAYNEQDLANPDPQDAQKGTGAYLMRRKREFK